jgi:hypothetical protein
MRNLGSIHCNANALSYNLVGAPMEKNALQERIHVMQTLILFR